MQVQFEVPEDLALQFGPDPRLVNRAALEALAVEGIRSGQITVSQARRLLGIESRYETDGFLKSRGILLDTTLDEVRQDSDVALRFSR